MIWLWLGGLLRARKARLAGSVAGVGLTVALLALLGAFLTQSGTSMTARAVREIPVDWQLQLVPGEAVAEISSAAAKAARIDRQQTVGYASVEGFQAQTGATVQTTGAGKVLGLGEGYGRDFPGQIRLLTGTDDGVLIAQQTAANLHVAPGDRVTIQRPGLTPAEVQISGVIDLPTADSLFQAIGVPPGAAPQAPPDNVLLLALPLWHALFDPQAHVRPDSVRLQLHIALERSQLPDSPETAFIFSQRAAHNLEARIAGRGVLADNLAARLDAVRGDALYARVLFLFLGVPGCVLAMFLTLAVAASGSERRRREQALLRIRGAVVADILWLAAAEAVMVGIGGLFVGVALAVVWAPLLLTGGLLQLASVVWLGIAMLIGLLLAQLAIVLPAWHDLRQVTVQQARTEGVQGRPRIWQRIGLDFICLGLAGVTLWRTSSSGYQLVLAPEGVPTAQIDYQAFLAPLLFWLGMGLLILRLCELALKHGRRRLAYLLQPLAGALADLVAASISQQRRRVTQGIALVALGFAFATSTAIFNTTYNAQSRVDAELTNGSDVTVTGTMQAPASSRLPELARLSGVKAAQPLQHRYAYVGNDLQDLYGIDPLHIGEATRLVDAYFQGASAAALLGLLATTPDGVLVSEETAQDFQLQLGDELNLRLQSSVDQQYHSVAFHFIGLVREFPTAPHDSFLVANATYVSQQTGAQGAEIVLLRSDAADLEGLANAARKVVADLPGNKVSDLGEARRLIASGLTAVDLRGLALLELSFAVLMVTGASGLMLALGLAERRRTFAILSALGAKPRQLGAFIWSEALLQFVAGASLGALTGFGLAWMLVKLLTGVFDPPPESLEIPWRYLIALIFLALLSIVLAVLGALRDTRVPAVQRMREL
ncbi:FtsX-like permease family protein [Pseudomonas sp. NPDC087697]|uniref:FtsX-like permease family protein n=1 Tax=Pseudomonas sp. NPDC087697 TaxID=3364447 RepID=UPI003819919C